MKRIMAITFALGAIFMWSSTLAAQSGYGMNIGIGVSTSMNGSCNLTMEHPFGSKWALTASVGFRIRRGNASKETISHRSEFETLPVSDTLSGPQHRESFGFSFRPEGQRKGVAVTVGVEHTSSEGFDAICGISYRIPIWKGFCADLSYRVRCIAPVIFGSRDAGAAEVNIYYSF